MVPLTESAHKRASKQASRQRFASIEEVEHWLQDQEIDAAAWGMNGAKTVRDLWNEIDRGETELRANPPVRLVQVVRVIIRRDSRVLVEAGQVFLDGSTRERNRPPSEKLMPGEEPMMAAVRCLMEEMRVLPEHITLHPEAYYEEQVLGESDSYPGLDSCYTFHVIEATVEGLPDSSFSTDELSPGPGEPVSRHHWEWREEEKPDSPPI